jgi:hypothetical protein
MCDFRTINLRLWPRAMHTNYHTIQSKHPSGFTAGVTILSTPCRTRIRFGNRRTIPSTCHRCFPMHWCRIAVLSTSQSLSNSKILLRSRKRISSCASRPSWEATPQVVLVCASIRKLLCKGWAFSENWSFPVDYIHSDDEDERDTDCSRVRYCQTELDIKTHKE